MKTLLRLVVAILTCLAVTAYAEDLFQNRKPIPFEFGRPVVESDTIGGYPIWQADGKWRLMHLDVSGTSVYESITGPPAAVNQYPLGRAYLIQTEQGKLVSSMQIRVNLAQAQADSWSGDICGGEDFLWKKSLGDSFVDVNCVFLGHITGFRFHPVFKPYLARLQQENIEIPLTVLAITVLRLGSNGRQMTVELIVNPELYGFQRETGGNWDTSPWHKDFALKDPKKKEFIDQLTQWAEAFATRVGGPAFRKDTKAFDGFTVLPRKISGLVNAPAQSRTQRAAN